MLFLRRNAVGYFFIYSSVVQWPYLVVRDYFVGEICVNCCCGL